MKLARFILKIMALSLTVAAVACAVIAYWDGIVECVQMVGDKLAEKKASLCARECDDYAE